MAVTHFVVFGMHACVRLLAGGLAVVNHFQVHAGVAQHAWNCSRGIARSVLGFTDQKVQVGDGGRSLILWLLHVFS
jgi:hypothetical protein